MAFRILPLRAFVRSMLRRFAEENFDQLSASLAFTTLLSLVPLVAVFLGVLSVLPVFADMVERLDYFLLRNLLPERSASMIMQYILEFSQKAANVTLVGLAGLLLTVFFLLLSIERAFNHVWRAGNTRSWRKKMGLYVVMLVLWPLVVSCVVLLSYHALTSSLGLIDDPAWLHGLMFKASGWSVAAIFFAGLYYAVPNARVAPPDAMLAGVFAASGFLLMQKAFGFYLLYFPSLTLVYGAFATLPVFLLWLYCSWAVVLAGALVAALLPEYRASES
jgi:membrane protein